MHTYFVITLASTAAALVAAQAPLGHALHERRDVSPYSSMTKRDRVEGNIVLPMRIGLKQPNLDIAPEWLMEISDPSSPRYGQHWTQDQVIEAFRPSDDTVDQVMDWLVASGISKHRITHSDNKQWLAFDAFTHEAENLTYAEYYGHEDSQGRTMIACDEYHIPLHLQEHIDYITPGVKGIHTSSPKPVLQKRRRPGPGMPKKPILLTEAPALASVPCSESITPACLRALYNFTTADQHAKVSSNNSLGIFETGDEYDQLDLNSFFTHYASFVPNGTHPKLDSVDGALAPGPPEDTEGEAVLDFELAFPIVYPQQIILYQVDNDTGEDRNGIFNTFLDALDGSYCNYSAYGEKGDDPTLDPTYPDPYPGGYTGKLQCGVYKPTNVISISYGVYENQLPGYYQKRQCNEYLKLGLQGVTVVVASGDTGVGGACMSNNGVSQFSPTQPNSCPWILNVGATQINSGQTVNDPEVAVNDPDDEYWSSGGFSNLFAAPSYQTAAIAQYFKVSNPPYKYYYNGSYANSTGLYNRNGRGIPDVAANGQNIATYTGGSYFANGGTSASAPIFASLINRIIEERIKVGKGPLGFINPTLYKNPQILNDIVKGGNPGCGTKGFSCAKGWDPVTGLGTPNYPKMLKFFLSQP